MEEVTYLARDKDAFAITENNGRVAEMVVSTVGPELWVYHTGVLERMQGQGYGTKLFDAMVAHARQQNLIVTTYCPFVQGQFKKDPEAYADIWNQQKPQLRAM